MGRAFGRQFFLPFFVILWETGSPKNETPWQVSTIAW